MTYSGNPYARSQRVDGNHRTIVEALRWSGVMVADLSGAGRGVPDLLCGYRGILFCVEVKTLKGALSKAQREWFDEWAEYPALVLRSVADVQDVVEVLRHADDLSRIDWAALVPRGRRRSRPLGIDTGARRPTRRRHRRTGLDPFDE